VDGRSFPDPSFGGQCQEKATGHGNGKILSSERFEFEAGCMGGTGSGRPAAGSLTIRRIRAFCLPTTG